MNSNHKEVFNKFLTENPDFDLLSFNEELHKRRKLKYQFDYLNSSADSIWILIINNLHIPNEIDLAKQILIWKEFTGKKQTMVKCSPASEQIFYDSCKHTFNEITELPVLIFSNDYDFDDYIIIHNKALNELINEKTLDVFLNKTHGYLRVNKSLKSIRKDMKTQNFWDSLKIGYQEFKSLITFKGTADLN